MLKKNLILMDDQDLDYAIHYKSLVAVSQNHILIESGVIESYSNDAIRINGGYVLRKLCEIKVL
jgi:hypothetical protein